MKPNLALSLVFLPWFAHATPVPRCELTPWTKSGVDNCVLLASPADRMRSYPIPAVRDCMDRALTMLGNVYTSGGGHCRADQVKLTANLERSTLTGWVSASNLDTTSVQCSIYATYQDATPGSKQAYRVEGSSIQNFTACASLAQNVREEIETQNAHCGMVVVKYFYTDQVIDVSGQIEKAQD